MARRRRKVRFGAAAAPPPPAAPQIAKPKQNELKEIYKRIVTANITNRVGVMHEALAWWDTAVDYYTKQKSLTAAQLKTYSQAQKARAMAIGGSTEQEQETAAKQTIGLYQKVFADHHIPSFDPYWKLFLEKKDVLEAKETAAKARFQTITEALNSAFAPSGLTFDVVKSDQARAFDGSNKILLSINHMKSLAEKAKTEGLLPVLFSEVTSVIRSYALEEIPDPTTAGGSTHRPNLVKAMQSIPVFLDGILKYIGDLPRNKVFKQYGGVIDPAVNVAASNGTAKVTSTVKAPKTPSAPRTPRVHTGGARIAGKYAPGSAMGELYIRLSDQKVHALSDILANLNVGNPRDRLKFLQKHGIRNGKWTITQAGNTIQMVIN